MLQITHPAAVTTFVVLLLLPIGQHSVRAHDHPSLPIHSEGPAKPSEPIPADRSMLESWFERNVPKDIGPGVAEVLGHALAAPPLVIKVRADGSGDFKTISEAVASIPTGNQKRAIISIGPGNYTERVRIDKDRPFVTLYGDPSNQPVIVNNGTAGQYGTAACATLHVDADYFAAANLKVVNNAPRPVDLKNSGFQAVAMKIRAEYGSFYNCRFHGFQDTLFDYGGKHLFKDCYIEGTCDFIFGNGQTIYLNTEILIHPGDPMAIITAQSRQAVTEPTGFVFVHCNVTGTGGFTYLGRPWFPAARVIWAYCDLSDAINPKGWLNTNKWGPEKTYLGEYNNKGPGAVLDQRVPYTKKMTAAEAAPFLNLAYIEASKWLLHPTKVQCH